MIVYETEVPSFAEWLNAVEETYPEVRLTRTRNMLRAAWFAAAKFYNNPAPGVVDIEIRNDGGQPCYLLVMGEEVDLNPDQAINLKVKAPVSEPQGEQAK